MLQTPHHTARHWLIMSYVKYVICIVIFRIRNIPILYCDKLWLQSILYFSFLYINNEKTYWWVVGVSDKLNIDKALSSDLLLLLLLQLLSRAYQYCSWFDKNKGLIKGTVLSQYRNIITYTTDTKQLSNERRSSLIFTFLIPFDSKFTNNAYNHLACIELSLKVSK